MHRAVAGSALLLCLACSNGESTKGMVSEEALAIAVAKTTEVQEAAAIREADLQAQIDRQAAEIAQLRAQLGGKVSPSATAATATADSRVPEESKGIAVELASLSWKPVEANSTWTRFSWQASVRNNLDRRLAMKLTVYFRDSDSFELEDQTVRFALQPFEHRTVGDVKLITASVAARVEKMTGTLLLDVR